MKIRLASLILTTAALQMVHQASAMDYFAYFGTFTNETSRGIYVSRLDTASGKLSTPELAAAIPSPNFLAVSPNGRVLYAVTRGDGSNGSVGVFALDGRTGKLSLLDQNSSAGVGPCHVSVDATGRTVLVANYGSGSVKSFRANAEGLLADGTFVQHAGRSVNEKRQSGPHAHCFTPSPTGRFALACDLGLDQVLVYQVNPTNATLAANVPAFASVPPGSGPRHLVFSPDGQTAYVVNELACTVTVFAWDEKAGKLDLQQTVSILPAGVEVTPSLTAAEIVIRPDGRFVYVTLRGHDSVSVLAVDPKSGQLTLAENVPCGGKVPRGMDLDPTGRWLLVANQKSENVTVFAVDATTGRLAATGQTLAIGSPVDVEFAPVR